MEDGLIFHETFCTGQGMIWSTDMSTDHPNHFNFPLSHSSGWFHDHGRRGHAKASGANSHFPAGTCASTIYYEKGRARKAEKINWCERPAVKNHKWEMVNKHRGERTTALPTGRTGPQEVRSNLQQNARTQSWRGSACLAKNKAIKLLFSLFARKHPSSWASSCEWVPAHLPYIFSPRRSRLGQDNTRVQITQCPYGQSRGCPLFWLLYPFKRREQYGHFVPYLIIHMSMVPSAEEHSFLSLLEEIIPESVFAARQNSVLW